MVFAVVMALVITLPTQEKPVACTTDIHAALALDEEAFDQGPDGWRRLVNSSQCFLAAADLIRSYRISHNSHGQMLYWHEGQMRAAAGQYKRAIPLLNAARARRNEWNVDSGWNHYVDASIAFLRRDRIALKKPRLALSLLPPPSQQPQAATAAKAQERPADWPSNLEVIDGLIRCYNQPYAEAVNPSCRAAANANP